jgi:voltage-gated potassium channel
LPSEIVKVRRSWIGFNKVPAGESMKVRALGRATAPWMAGIALLAMGSFYLEDLQRSAALALWGPRIDGFILAAFAIEMACMLALCRKPARYLRANWLKLVIVASSGLVLWGARLHAMPVAHLLHLIYVALVFAWLLGHVRAAFSRSVIPFASLLGAGAVLLAAVGFYRIEPTVHSYGQGVWLAFTTAATVGYGDIVPTSAAAKVLAALDVVVGYAVFSLITGGIAALFIGQAEKQARHALHCEVEALRDELRQSRIELTSRRPDDSGPKGLHSVHNDSTV